MNVIEALVRVLRPEHYHILRASGPGEALSLLATHPVSVIISDQRMPEMDGVELLRKVKKLYPNTVRIMLTGYADQKITADAINDGALYKFISKPWEQQQLLADVRDAFKHHDFLVRSRQQD